MKIATRTRQKRPPISSSRYLITVAAILIYAMVLARMLISTGNGAIAALAIVPAVIGGWLLGARGGLGAAIVTLVISFLIFVWLDDGMTLLRGGAFGNVLVIILGVASGWLSDLLAQVRQQATDLQREIELLAEAGFPPLDVIVAATRNGAQALGQFDQTGTIETGKRADLLEERAEARRPRRKRGKILTFLGHVVDELRRVQWPDRRQTGQGTAVTLGFVVVAGGFLGLMDAVWKPLVDWLI